MGLYPPMLHPDLEKVAGIYLSGRAEVTVAVGTKLPPTPPNRTKPAPFLRTEFGGGGQINPLEFRLHTILHSYNADEDAAADTSITATALLGAASGETVNGWFISHAVADVLTHRTPDPDVPNMARYRSQATWIVTGKPLGSPITP
ncbi:MULTISPECIES: hypothetical protein [Mycobacteroides]|uniref:Tail terminator n=2 Tax=Mycobacteroides TaxID=670516 RepID=A0ABR5LTA9_9MYCO|nr:MULTISPECIES: hypothetical protein [Mycobacteroides]KPG34316.1 hypothetical protein AN912_11255 [Mycobacteroides immunogenum]ORB55251.1 hypothetical protein BST43_15400 [Mycobacteroides saopaulense]SKN57498.1 Uncharacterised protein [Mycobacteroides abscessus subsp. massiliense]SKR66219.1 Uncharacterised protein [Mycobacteroides abscessus subsp. abscessus]SLH52746.1 Uncharacterised protein [Mycobacteroides abscessus subsp. massiliense]